MRRRGPEAAVLVLACAACATLPAPPPAVVAQARAVRTYSASLRVALRTPELRGRGRVLLAFSRPDALRLEVPGPGGARLIAVARGGALVALFPGERAVFSGEAGAAQMEALLGMALEPREVMDLLVGVGAPRLRAYDVRWGRDLPREVRATLPDGGRLTLKVEDAQAEPALAPAAFDEPPHAGYRTLSADEARALWLGR